MLPGDSVVPRPGDKGRLQAFLSFLACFLYPFVTERTVGLALSLMSRSTLLLLVVGEKEGVLLASLTLLWRSL